MAILDMFGSVKRMLRQVLSEQDAQRRRIQNISEMQTLLFVELKFANERLHRIEADIRQIKGLLTRKLPKPPPIEVMNVVLIRERRVKGDDMATKVVLDYEVTLKAVEDAPENDDVATRKLSVVVGGEVASSQELPRAALAAVVTDVPKGSKFLLRQSYVDDDGNEGDATDSAEMDAVDTLRPNAPGADFASIKLVRERTVEVPDPEPEPEPPAPEPEPEPESPE